MELDAAAAQAVARPPDAPGVLASLPRPTPGVETRLRTIEGAAPSLAERPHACVFSPRCPAAIDVCAVEKPPLERIDATRMVKCHRWREIAEGSLVISTEPLENVASTPPQANYVFKARDLTKRFQEDSLLDRMLGNQSEGVRAVDHVSLRIRERSTLGLVGESGSGKTTLARLIVGLTPADGGEMELLDVPLRRVLSERPRETLRNLQMIFQNPNDALNPYHTVGQTLARTLRRLGAISGKESQSSIAQLLDAVRLTPDYARRYPGELSGGEKQRVAIARAFAANPALVVADEPTSSLDVSVQSVILNLLKDLRAREGASYLLISHNLDVVSYLADWIAVMYLGEIVEEGDAEQVYNAPSHPYTEALVSARPIPDPMVKQRAIRLDGDAPSARHIPSGCRFHTRCPRKLGAICEQEAPPWRDAGDGHFIRCHIPIDDLIALQASPPERQTDAQ